MGLSVPSSDEVAEHSTTIANNIKIELYTRLRVFQVGKPKFEMYQI